MLMYKVRQRNLSTFKMRYVGNLEGEMAGIISRVSLTGDVAVGMEEWSAQHRVFMVEMFLKIVTAVKTQRRRIFRKHFNIVRHGKVPCRNTVQLWVEPSEQVLPH
jgi:predicted TPR repeat methyltransferase